MPTSFYVTSNNITEIRKDVTNKGDAVTYSFDFTPWQEDNSAITGVTWTLESGNAAISGEVLTSGVATALVTFSDAGRSLISILATTAAQKKKIFLEVRAKDYTANADDYGFCG